MILTIIFLGMVLLGIMSIELGKNNYSDFGDFLEIFGGLSTMIGSTCLIISIIAIIVGHATAPKLVRENNINYSGLCKRYEVVKSEYEDVSKSDVIADITAWNMKVYNVKYWTYNPWTNWFNPKEIADNLDYILLE